MFLYFSLRPVGRAVNSYSFPNLTLAPCPPVITISPKSPTNKFPAPNFYTEIRPYAFPSINCDFKYAACPVSCSTGIVKLTGFFVLLSVIDFVPGLPVAQRLPVEVSE